MTYLIGLVIGTVLGLTGAGGSVFAVPLLIWLLDLTPQAAIGLSLGTVSVSALFGVGTRLGRQEIQWLPVIVYATIGGLIAPVGNALNQKIDPAWLMLGFSLLVFIVAIRLWRQASQHPDDSRVVRASISSKSKGNDPICRVNNNAPFKVGLPCALGMAGGAMLTGLLSGLFGVGGGFIIVPVLLYLTGINIKQAVATSLAIICVISLSGFVGFLQSDIALEYTLLTQISIGGILGMTLGVVISRYVAGPLLQKIFAGLMCMMAIIAATQTLI